MKKESWDIISINKVEYNIEMNRYDCSYISQFPKTDVSHAGDVTYTIDKAIMNTYFSKKDYDKFARKEKLKKYI